MKKVKIQYFKSSFGEMILGSLEDMLCMADWRYRKLRSTIDRNLLKHLEATFLEEESPIINEARNQLKEYFRGQRKEFDIPLVPVGTNFQKSVWEELMRIPYGSTDTYLGLSRKLGDEKSIRAVANANGANAISIIIPCHRIIGSKGEMVGYGGGLETKKKLLQLESGGKIPEQMSLF